MNTLLRSFCIVGFALLPAACHHNGGNGGDVGNNVENPRIINIQGKGPIALDAADLNDDGYADIVTANWKSHNVSVL